MYCNSKYLPDNGLDFSTAPDLPKQLRHVALFHDTPIAGHFDFLTRNRGVFISYRSSGNREPNLNNFFRNYEKTKEAQAMKIHDLFTRNEVTLWIIFSLLVPFWGLILRLLQKKSVRKKGNMLHLFYGNVDLFMSWRPYKKQYGLCFKNLKC